MAVFRIHKSKDFTVMSNHHLRNKELSLKAKGLLTLMLSLPDDWDYSSEGLELMSSDGLSSVKSGLRELEAFKYLVRTQAMAANGTFSGYNYDIYETPYEEKPSAEKPSVENPSTENPPQLNTNIESIDGLSTNGINEDNSSRTINSTSNNISSSKERVKKGLDLSFVATEYIEAFGEWLNYKRSINDMYKTQRGVERAYKDLLAACNNNPANALTVVNYSIDKEYKGIYAPKKQSNYGNNSTQTQQPVNRFQELAKHFHNTGGVL